MCQIIGLGFLVRHSTAETGFPPGGLERGRESRPVTTTQQTKGTENTKLLRIQMDLGKQIKNLISVGILFQASLLPLLRPGFTLTHGRLKVHGGVPIVLCIFVDPL